RRKLYHKAKAEPSWRFGGFTSILAKWERYAKPIGSPKKKKGAPGGEGGRFGGTKPHAIGGFLGEPRRELRRGPYRPFGGRKVGIPKEGGTRQLSIPAIRGRVVQGALKLILEPIFEADFQPGSYGYRPKKSAHGAIQRVAEAILEGKTDVIDLDLNAYFDHI